MSAFLLAACLLATVSSAHRLRADVAPPPDLATPLTAVPIANTPYGRVMGITQLTTVSAFRAIPFAEPPVGDLRFAPTAPLKKGWNGVLDGTKPSAGCMAECSPKVYPRPSYQCAARQAEDCLYLNVFTPAAMGANGTRGDSLLPVLVYFHGGNYMFGSAALPMYDGAMLAKSQQVVVVTTNYRLGVFGGLFTGNVKGNFQTQDQRQALKFVREIIGSFGGDKDDVTISGQSAGAASVAAHMVSPASWPYFHRAIMMSNPSSMPTASRRYALSVGNVTLQLLGCGAVGSVPLQQELACLRSIAASDLLNASAFISIDTPNLLEINLRWGPVVDGEEFVASPFAILTGSPDLPRTNPPLAAKPVPVLMGTTQDEGAQFVHMAFAKPATMAAATLVLKILFGDVATGRILSLYAPNGTVAEGDARPMLSEVMTDYLFFCSNRRIAGGLTGALNTTTYPSVPNLFFYHYNHQGSWTPWLYNTIPECATNVCHAEDVPAVFRTVSNSIPFGPPDMPGPKPEEEMMMHAIQGMWGRFIREGHPGEVPAGEGGSRISFPSFSYKTLRMVQQSVPFALLERYRSDRCAFWDAHGYGV